MLATTRRGQSPAPPGPVCDLSASPASICLSVTTTRQRPRRSGQTTGRPSTLSTRYVEENCCNIILNPHLQAYVANLQLSLSSDPPTGPAGPPTYPMVPAYQQLAAATRLASIHRTILGAGASLHQTSPTQEQQVGHFCNF